MELWDSYNSSLHLIPANLGATDRMRPKDKPHATRGEMSNQMELGGVGVPSVPLISHQTHTFGYGACKLGISSALSETAQAEPIPGPSTFALLRRTGPRRGPQRLGVSAVIPWLCGEHPMARSHSRPYGSSYVYSINHRDPCGLVRRRRRLLLQPTQALSRKLRRAHARIWRARGTTSPSIGAPRSRAP